MASQNVTIELVPILISPELIIAPKEKVAAIPVIKLPDVVRKDTNRPLILNIETLGFRPWEERIITIGFVDPKKPGAQPFVIMQEDEKQMIIDFMDIFVNGNYDQIIGYNISFDFRYILIRAMFHNIPLKQFLDADLYDLMEAMSKGKFKFVFNAQKPPSLSDISEFFYNYPKPFSDLEMMAFYLSEDFEKVLEFAYSQIFRTRLLYYDFLLTQQTLYLPGVSGSGGNNISSDTPPMLTESSLLTLPELQPKTTWTAKCPVDLSEHEVPLEVETFICPIDGSSINKPGA